MYKKVSIECIQCHNVYTLSLNPQYFGKMISVKCNNCGKLIRFRVRRAVSKEAMDPNGTLVGVSNNDNKILRLEINGDKLTLKQNFIINQDNVTVGRKNNDGPAYRSDIEIVTADKYMSRVHCALQKKNNGRYVIKDIGKRNRILLNDNEIGHMDEYYLNDGDLIQLGQTVIKVLFVSQK